MSTRVDSVPFDPEFLDALNECCDTLTEFKLITHIMRLANSNEPGKPFRWTLPVMMRDLAKSIGCTPQNINGSAARLFGEYGLIERSRTGTGDPRAHTYRVRGERWSEWLNFRRAEMRGYE